MTKEFQAFFVLAIVALHAGQVFSARAVSGERKLSFMKAESAASKLHVVRFDKTSFIEYVINGPRPYDLVVLFTALDRKIDCGACRSINDNEMKPLAQAVYSASLKAATPVFLVEMDYAHRDVRDLFMMMDLSNVPSLIYVPADEDISTPKPETFLKKLSDRNKFDFNTRGFKAQTILDWVNSKSDLGAQIVTPIDWNEVLTNIGIPLVALAVTLYFFGPYIWAMRKFTKIYLFGSFAIYLFCVSGGMYNILKNTPWVHVDQNGVSYMHGDSGWQLGSESYICGGAQLLLGMLLIFLSTTAVEFNKESVRQVFVAGTILLSFYVWYLIRWLVSRKMHGYNHGWVYEWLQFIRQP